MTVQDVNEKITLARRIVGLIGDKAIALDVVKPLREPIVDMNVLEAILVDYISLLNRMEVSERIINYKVYKEDET